MTKQRSVLLSTLLKNASPAEILGAADHLHTRRVNAVFCDSREAHEHRGNGLFVCISGAAFDGHSFARAVYDGGCRIFAVTKPLDLPNDALQLVYENTRKALALLSAAFYGHPSKELTVIGVTGTKGKTTTCLLAQAVLSRFGIPTGYIGTSGIRFADRAYESPNTTPESLILQRTMREMADCGIRVLVMEVSSQALMQYRVYGMRFQTVVFTNLSRDHIGPLEHPSFEHYRDTKRTLFSDYGAETLILNADDPNAAAMLPSAVSAKVETFSAQENTVAAYPLAPPTLSASDAFPTSPDDGRLGIRFSIEAEESAANCSERRRFPAFLPLPGLCNVHNALAALLMCKTLGIAPQDAAETLSSVSISGRCEMIEAENGAKILIDYAHNEASLREILKALRDYEPKRLIVLFGSVGGRTKDRRKTMGAVASELADFCVLTSDNPDFEPPMDIIKDIRSGFMRDCPHALIPDRREAIHYALSIAEKGDILLLAGKGHESYQLICGEKRPFSEREIVAEWLTAQYSDKR